MYKLKILIRKNLNMSLNKTASQAAHAAIALYKKYPNIQHKAIIVLDISDKKFNESKSLNCVIIQDAGYTEVESGTETTLAFFEKS